ncbi:hypothetical protein [Frankia sp. QA3]|uniref:hypothetical protein n=1 Tax=Frankia sp. QA3 TaxID=710111 RepID=UPI0012F93F9D
MDIPFRFLSRFASETHFSEGGEHEGFRVAAARSGDVRRVNHQWSQVRVPKVGWMRFRRSRAAPDAKSYRVTRDRAGRWYVAFTIVPAPMAAPGTGEVVGVDRGVAVCSALSSAELRIPTMTRSARGMVAKPGRNARQKAGVNRVILAAGRGLLVQRLEQQASGRVERIPAAYPRPCFSACGRVASASRASQVRFRRVARRLRCSADVNAARNIAAGRAVTARGGAAPTEPANRESQHCPPSLLVDV